MHTEFSKLPIGSEFILSLTGKRFIKMNKRKRSDTRPFDCNAKTVSGSYRTVASGWFEPETFVYPYKNGIKVYVDPCASDDKEGYLHVNTIESVISVLKNIDVSEVSMSTLFDDIDNNQYGPMVFYDLIEQDIKLGRSRSTLLFKAIPTIYQHDTNGRTYTKYVSMIDSRHTAIQQLQKETKEYS